MQDHPCGGLTPEEVAQILSLVERSDFDSIEVSFGDLHVFASKTADIAPTRSSPTPQQPPTRASAAPWAAPGPPPGAETVSADVEMEDAAADGLSRIVSPVVGTFYIAPEPGAAPFADIGAQVSEDTTVGLVEVMKTFIDVKAGCSGMVVERLVQNGDGVEFGEALFLVEPDPR